jgi:hypothetical protein
MLLGLRHGPILRHPADAMAAMCQKRKQQRLSVWSFRHFPPFQLPRLAYFD